MEQWKEFLPSYFVSTFGNVESSKFKKRRSLRQYSNRKGYLRVRLSVDNKEKHIAVHRLVAQAFIPNPENKPQVNHINGIKTDNRVENLEWVTASENLRHAYVSGLKVAQKGEARYNARLTENNVLYIRANPDKLTTAELAKMFNICKTTISRIQLGKKWKSVGGFIRQANPHPSKLTVEQRTEIKQLYVQGSKEFGSVSLGKKYGVDHSVILRIVKEQ